MSEFSIICENIVETITVMSRYVSIGLDFIEHALDGLSSDVGLTSSERVLLLLIILITCVSGCSRLLKGKVRFGLVMFFLLLLVHMLGSLVGGTLAYQG